MVPHGGVNRQQDTHRRHVGTHRPETHATDGSWEEAAESPFPDQWAGPCGPEEITAWGFALSALCVASASRRSGPGISTPVRDRG
jgi:hypothetical protein